MSETLTTTQIDDPRRQALQRYVWLQDVVEAPSEKPATNWTGFGNGFEALDDEEPTAVHAWGVGYLAVEGAYAGDAQHAAEVGEFVGTVLCGGTLTGLDFNAERDNHDFTALPRDVIPTQNDPEFFGPEIFDMEAAQQQQQQQIEQELLVQEQFGLAA